MAANSGRSDDIAVINIGSLQSSLEEHILKKAGNLSMPKSYCIFKTPSIFFRHKRSAFLPNCFSIGPIHHRKKNLVPAEKIKVKYLNDLLSRVLKDRSPETTTFVETSEFERQKILNDWINAVRLIEEQARACYAGVDFAGKNGDEFVNIMVLDAVFLIELFRKDAKEGNEDDDPIFSMSCMLQFLNHDLILLENQIPWLVLKTLFEKTKLPSETKSLIELALNFFKKVFTSHPPRIKPDLFIGEDIKHILDLLRLSVVLPSEEIKTKTKHQWQPIRSTTKLKEAGVKFKAIYDADSILDIKFRKGTVEIPSLLVQETTETILRNLIAYEQCLPKCQPIFTSYAKLLDNLIDDPNDAELLCKKQILDNWFSPEDSAQFFIKLYHDTYVKEFYYATFCDELNKHCLKWWPAWRASYVQNYFTKPWAIVAQIYGLIILAFTVMQTFKKDNSFLNFI